tara:strand:+ start:3916 stop:4287 length:372 start_codon:yes stop_codon:yes gene_type:complete
MRIEVSIGEIVDKLSILLIKKNKIKDKNKLSNVLNECNYLSKIVFNELKIEQEDFSDLFFVNEELWNIEDKLREKEKNKEFDEEFIGLARKVYYTNDRRADIKKLINTKYKSGFIEEKSYEKY